jgi:formate dehydrogenase iron-sulfur subunit
MIHQRAEGKLIGPGSAILLLLMAAGALAAVYRFYWGLGHSTNLSDQYPWGLWVGVDVMSGVALAAGGFTTAALVYLFGGHKYYPLVRPAVLTGFLGYVFVGVGLLLDLALPWHIWHPIVIWPEHSVMLEVAWCVMLYLTVLALEFAPAVFERFKLTGKPLDLWRSFTTVFSVVAVAFFVGVISLSWIWAIVTLVFFGALARLLSAVGPRRPGVPVMLIIAGVVFSTMHQSSLGSLFLLMKDKLDPLWWTPSLPINFFLSAVAVGFAMVILEATLSARAFRRPIEKEALAGLGKFLASALWIYLGYRLLDLAVRGSFARIGSSRINLFLLEIIVGALVPAVMLTNSKVRHHSAGRFLAASLVVFGVVFNRCNVTWLAMNMPGQGTYLPSLVELIITVSLIASLVFFFALAVKSFPVFAQHEE